MTDTEEKQYLKDEVAAKIFTDTKCKNYTARVISSTLGLDYDYVKDNLTILDPKVAGNIENKGTVVDAIYEHKEFYLNIEINYNYYEEGRIKNTLYIAQLLLRQTHPGDSYLKTRPIIQININGFDYFGKGEFLYKSYIMDEKYHMKRENLIEIYDINVDYLNEKAYNEVKDLRPDDLEYLLYIFVCSDKDTREYLYKENPYMNEVFDKMEELTKEFDGILYYNRKEFLEHAAYHQGQKDGKSEGAKEKQLEIAKNFLNEDIPLKIIAKNTGLSLKELEQLKNAKTKES